MGGKQSKKKKEREVGRGGYLLPYPSQTSCEIVMFPANFFSGEKTGRHSIIKKYFSFYDADTIPYDYDLDDCYDIIDLSFGKYEKGEKRLQVFLPENRERDYTTLYDGYIREADAFLVTFTQGDTVEEVEQAIERFCRIKDVLDLSLDYPTVLIKTKLDICEEDYDDSLIREYASHMDLGFIETSAKTGENIRELFQHMGDWFFLGEDQELKNHLPQGTNIKKAR